MYTKGQMIDESNTYMVCRMCCIGLCASAARMNDKLNFHKFLVEYSETAQSSFYQMKCHPCRQGNTVLQYTLLYILQYTPLYLQYCTYSIVPTVQYVHVYLVIGSPWVCLLYAAHIPGAITDVHSEHRRGSPGSGARRH